MVLGTAFQDQANALGADVNFSVSGAFTPRKLPARTLPTGVAVACRVVMSRTDPRITLGQPGARFPGWFAILKKSEVPDQPREDDEITVSEGEQTGSYLVRTLDESEFSPYWHLTLKVKPA